MDGESLMERMMEKLGERTHAPQVPRTEEEAWRALESRQMDLYHAPQLPLDFQEKQSIPAQIKARAAAIHAATGHSPTIKQREAEGYGR